MTVWLSPVQVKILPVSDKYLEYAKEISERIKAQNIRIEIDARNEKCRKYAVNDKIKAIEKEYTNRLQ